jgi:hypothetical protein
MIGLWNLTIIDHKRDARPERWCHLYCCHGTIVPAWLLFVQYKKKTVTLNLVNEFFCAITQNLNTCKNHSTASKYSCNTTINATQLICAHKTWSDGGENSNHTNSWKPCNTNPIHHTIPNFSFLSFFFSYFGTMAIPQTDSEFSQFHIFLNEATLSYWLFFKIGKMLNLDLETMI